MPDIVHADGPDVTRVRHEQFVELLCADEELLRAEFDAIVAAEWPSPPPADPEPGAMARPSRRPARRRREGGAVTARRRPRHPGVGGWARERSPPAGPWLPQHDPGEAGDGRT